MCLVVDGSRERHTGGIAAGYLLGVDEYEAAREVGRILGRGRLDDLQVVDLAAGDDVVV